MLSPFTPRFLPAVLPTLVLLSVPAARAEPPRVTAPPTVAVGEVVQIEVEAAAGKSLGHCPTFKPADAFMARLWSPPESPTHLYLFQAKRPGPFAVVWWTVGDDRGEATTITAAGSGPAPNPTDPPPTDPKPPAPTGLFFVVLRPDGPASADLVKAMSLPAWKKLADAGHRHKEYTPAEALSRLNVSVPPGTALPCVVTLRPGKDRSEIVGPPKPLPATDDGVLDLAGAGK